MADPAAPPELAEEMVLAPTQPIEHEGESYSRLVLREPLVGEARKIYQHSGATSTIVGLALIAGVPEAVIRKAPARSVKAGERYVLSFLNWSPPPVAPEDLPLSLDLPLRRAVKFGGETIDKLRLREPTGGELEEIDRQDGFESAVTAVRVVAALPEAVVDQMAIRDFNAAADYLLGFLS